MSSDLFFQMRKENPEIAHSLLKIQDFLSTKESGDVFPAFQLEGLKIQEEELSSSLIILQDASILSQQIYRECRLSDCAELFSADEEYCPFCKTSWRDDEDEGRELSAFNLIRTPLKSEDDEWKSDGSLPFRADYDLDKSIKCDIDDSLIYLEREILQGRAQTTIQINHDEYIVFHPIFRPEYGSGSRCYIYEYQKIKRTGVTVNRNVTFNGPVGNYTHNENSHNTVNVNTQDLTKILSEMHESILNANIQDQKLLNAIEALKMANPSDSTFAAKLNQVIAVGANYATVIGLSLSQLAGYLN
ncbi:hypothetical protein [Bdellovibrio bacteriovorus]|uniref:hypothetical protein n=1 Tax=Bdellovibrio bacteriovorus TaxID=959 RepID=UPI0035A6DF57